MGRIGRGWQLVKLSLSIVRKDKEILIFPVLDAIVTLLILVSFILGIFLTAGFDTDIGYPFVLRSTVVLVVFYLLSYFVTVFFGAAVVGCATIRMNGGNPTVSDGLRIAKENVGRILLWALFAGTVGLIIQAIQRRVGFLGRIIMGAIGIAWTVVTYFAIPVLVYEKLGPWATVKRSASLFKSTWGETIVGGLGLGAIFVLLGLAGIPFLLLGFFIGGVTGLVVAAVVAFVYWVSLAIIASAAKSVLIAALYRYATTGKTYGELEAMNVANPWSA